MKTYITSITLILFFILAGPQLVFSQGQEDRDPISFELVDAQGDDIVYIDNNTKSKGQTMRMVLLNNDINPLLFSSPKTGTVGRDNYHFKLEIKHNNFKYFEKKVLDNIKLASASTSIYQMAVNTDDSEYVYFYILITDIKSYILQPSTRRFIGLTGFKASSKSGPMASVPIRLHYHNAHYQSAPNSSISNTFDSAIRIKNENGLENIPIHAGLLGSQSILNDGKTSNSLIIGLENVAIPNATHPEADKIYYDKSTTIVISYKLEPNDKTPWAYPWALTTKNQFNKKSVTLPIIKLNNETQPTSYWKAKKLDKISWVLTAQGKHSLSPKDVLKIELGGIVSAMPDGVSHIYVHYNNIEGYYNGFFSIPVTKSHIFEKDEKIGIGIKPTQKNKQTLQINGGILARSGTPRYDKKGNNVISNNGYSFLGNKSEDTGLFSPSLGEISLYSNGWERLSIDTDFFSVLGFTEDNKKYITHFEIAKGGPITTSSSISIGGDISSATGNITNIGEINTRDQIVAGGYIQSDGAVYAKGGIPGGYNADNTGFAFQGGNGDYDSGMFSSHDGEVSFYSNSRKRLTVTSDSIAIIKYSFTDPEEVLFKVDNDGMITYAKDRPNSAHGTVASGDTVTPPYGTTDDWSILVSTERANDNTENSGIKWINCWASAAGDKKTWTITVKTGHTSGGTKEGRANYLIVRK